ncbi:MULTISPECIES: DUF2937 family protein [Methylobacterium]|uniref:DUF2937 domain-containing protein n=2 Tax=Pseudomonadota TaxID=1224 RepID=A0ABQ4SWT9_9HYPH|nr:MULTISPECIES: DUF2937 family protein [Methylobacterium]PIU05004.1 MAG: DUF2937 domain-containing protein [Methylobacterium sp. CG09_land_8_20_14_0_10_71_15]PIU11505.1 MAG: DUF2937 domain-containing protein [Methylobacterium sp. CG08_land_8_20_14_0_20_71_15]GBU16572.1 hypothetical protein AwMethylo_07870 [Methylobacterium sp.]GJE07622.1 hypothetical protein AOPFMNJM_2951 [Methylobacterium jeotgali]
MFRVVRTFGLALAILVGIVAAQAPEFAQQYAQRLGGAVDELRRQIASLDSDARATGNTRDGAVERLRTNPDALVARRGEAARGDIERLARLESQQGALSQAAGPLGRVVAIARDPDLPLAGATYRDYAPAVPTTTDGIVAGLLGFLLGWGGWRLIAETGRRMARPRRRPETTPV